MAIPQDHEEKVARSSSRLVYRQKVWTRLTHWIWAIALFFLLLSGLQIFNAHPKLYAGKQSGFAFDNAVVSIGRARFGDIIVGQTNILGVTFDTTGVLGVSGTAENPSYRAFPSWATIPSYQDLGTGRVVHFFFAWIFVLTLAGWFTGGLINGHIRRDLVPTRTDLSKLPRDIADHARLRFHHTRDYNVLQKLAYGGVLFVAFPLIILTGLAMSPTMNAAIPFLADVFGGRQSARTIHFAAMLALVAFFIMHMLMILAAGPINELRSMITGWYRIDASKEQAEGK